MGPESLPSSSMELKVSELLKDVRVDHTTAKVIDRAVYSLIDAIKAVPPQTVTSDAARNFVSDLAVPSDKASFTFRPPESFQVTGSHSIRALVKPHLHVDLLIRLPKECFHEKDYLNHRYHAKRGLYLCVIEKSLQSSPAVRKTGWASFQGEARKPVLIVFPVTNVAMLSEFAVRVIPTATSLFDITRLTLTRNNVRAFSQGDAAPPTPKYNSSILEDMFLEENSEYVARTFNEAKTLEEALVLVKVWARRRDSIFAHDCLNGYLISVLMSYLATRSGGINKELKALQIFRLTLKFLASTSFWEKGTILHGQGQANITKEVVSQYLQLFDGVLIDVSGHVNLAYRMRKAAISELQDEASWTINSMDKCRDGGFEEIFMTTVDFAAKFDSCLRIKLKENKEVCAPSFCLDDEYWRTCEDNVHSIMQRGLTDRVTLIRTTWRNTPSDWRIDDGFSKFSDEPMLVGMLHAAEETIFRVVDIGPSPESKEEATRFRNFWGEKAELRRFRDGRIAESTVWECEQWERHLIMKRITEYILSKQLHLSKGDVVHSIDQLDFALHVGGKDQVAYSSNLLGAFTAFAKQLRLLEDIPLKISSVTALDPALRHTSVYPPEPHPLAYEKFDHRKLPKSASTCLQPVDVMIQLEGSGNWPMDDVAIRKTKLAFLLKIGESLQDRCGMICSASEDEVNMLMSGYAFRLHLLHERGLNLRKHLDADRTTKNSTFVDMELFLRSQHSGMVNGLQGRYPIYGPVVRLAKRWIASHLFSSFVSEETVELIVAYLFLKPFPFHCPRSRVVGFLRFLRLLSNYDWSFSPLIVDINDDFSQEDVKQINDHFILGRKSSEENGLGAEPAMFLATPYDKFSEAWTKLSPNKTVLKRMCAYARSSADLLTSLILHGQRFPLVWECLFRTPLDNYDAVILLHRDKLPYPKRLLFPAEINGKHVIWGKASDAFDPYIQIQAASRNLDDFHDSLMINFDATKCLLTDLKKAFPETFQVWYDSLGSEMVGLTWNKYSLKKRCREETQELFDILKEVGEIGKGFVRSVYFLKAPKLN